MLKQLIFLFIVNKKYINFYSINQWQLVVYHYDVHAKLSTILGTKYKDFQHQYVFFCTYIILICMKKFSWKQAISIMCSIVVFWIYRFFSFVLDVYRWSYYCRMKLSLDNSCKCSNLGTKNTSTYMKMIIWYSIF